MKKILLILMASLLSTGSFAQLFTDVSRDKLSWGIKAGLNLADLSNSDTQLADAKMKPSFYAGLFAEFKVLGDVLSLQPEIIYSRQGTMHSYDDFKTYHRLNYFNVPVILKLYLVKGLSLDVGPQFGFLLNAKIRDEYDGDKLSGESITDLCEKFDFSLAMGFTYTAFNHLDITARYNLGLTNANKGDDKLRNHVIQVGLGYRF